jgi:hypothetical protein
MPFISSIRKKYNQPTDTSAAEIFEVTGGDVVYTAGGYKIHMFTTVGESSLNVNYKHTNSATTIGLLKSGLDIEYLVIGAGAAGGSRHGGGGGAGGMITSSIASLGVGGYATSVGAGGTGITGDSRGNAGQNTTFSTLTALGGGGGGTWQDGGNANSGGSGGGASNSANSNFGAGQQTELLPLNGQGFGNPGGSSTVWGNDIGLLRVGGGGGAGGKGINAARSPQSANGNTGVGGAGRASSILGTNYFWAAGGGGAGWGEPGAPGGRGGGGGGSHAGLGDTNALSSGTNGLQPGGSPATDNGNGGNGGTNTGSGGGGGQQVPSTGGSGGPGIVVVRYRI